MLWIWQKTSILRKIYAPFALVVIGQIQNRFNWKQYAVVRLGKSNQGKLMLGPIHPFDSSIVNQRSWTYPSGGSTAASYITQWWLETCFPGRSARPIRREVVPWPNCLTSFTENWWQIACCICSSCNKPKISIRRNHFYNQITSPSVQLMYIHLKLNWYSNSNRVIFIYALKYILYCEFHILKFYSFNNFNVTCDDRSIFTCSRAKHLYIIHALKKGDH